MSSQFQKKIRPALTAGMASAAVLLLFLSGGMLAGASPAQPAPVAPPTIEAPHKHPSAPSPSAHHESEQLLAKAKSMGVHATIDQTRCPGLIVLADKMCSHGPDPKVAESVISPLGGTQSATGPTALATPPCDGDGVTGNRVQPIYLTANGFSNTYAASLATIKTAVDYVDTVVERSAAQTGGTRRVRWVQGVDCEVDVLNLTLSGNHDFDSAIAALKGLGYNRPDRIYLIFAEWDDQPYCGIGEFWGDPTPTSNNASNYGNQFALTQKSCWTGRTPTHELFHTLGAVANWAPNSTQAGHCVDGTYSGSDVMCYAENGKTATDVCSAALPLQLDCNHNDYFYAEEPDGSDLDTHWNTARNKFLIGATHPPANDDFANAQALAIQSCGVVTLNEYTNDATEESGEDPTVAASVWYSVPAGLARSFSVDTSGSDFDTEVALWSGASLASLTLVTTNDDSGATGGPSFVSSTLDPSLKYWVSAGGYGRSVGNLTIKFTSIGLRNDCFASRTVVSGNTATSSFNLSQTSLEAGEQSTGVPCARSVWYQWTAPLSGYAQFDTAGATTNTTIAVYQRGAAPYSASTALLVTSDDESGTPATSGGGYSSSTTTAVSAGVTYVVQVCAATSSGGSGSVHITTLGDMVGINPTRLVDTRNGTGSIGGRMYGNTTRTLQVSGANGIPAGALGVILNVTAVSPSASGYLKLLPAGGSSTVSNLNFQSKTTLCNQVIVPLSASGKLDLTSVTGGSTDVLIDAAGYFKASGGTRHNSVTPVRAMDTRTGSGAALRPFNPKETKSLAIVGKFGVPSGATSVLLNVTAVNATGSGYLTLWPSTSTRPTASSLNWNSPRAVGNHVIVPIGTDGKIKVYAGTSATVEVTLDVLGYFGATGGRYHPTTPVRAWDTRSSSGNGIDFVGKIPGGQQKPAGLFGAGVPRVADTAILNITSVGADASGYMTNWSPDVAKPYISNLNYPATVARANLSTTSLGSTSNLNVYVSRTTYLVGDVFGYFTS